MPSRIAGVRTMWAFDDLVTAPLHGFEGTEDYWTRASSKPWLAKVAVPTLVLNARNDPFVPGRLASRCPREVSPCVTLEQPEDGGHVGFATGPLPGRLDWLPSPRWLTSSRRRGGRPSRARLECPSRRPCQPSHADSS